MWDYLAVSGRMDDRVTEFVDHLHEHFVDPVVVRRGRYLAPPTPGYSTEIKRESRQAYRYPDGPIWTDLRCENGSIIVAMAGALTRRNFLSFDFGDRARDPDHWVRIHRIAMACRFEVMLSSDDARDMAAARSALDEADDIESVLTVFRESSAVSDLNRRGARETVKVGPDLFDLLTRSAALHAATGGVFDVTAITAQPLLGLPRARGPRARPTRRSRPRARWSGCAMSSSIRRRGPSASRAKAWS